VICLGTYLMYSLILAPYLQNYLALRKEYQSYQVLLDSKEIRTKAIERLSQVKEDYMGILHEINEVYFRPEEADLFIKSLPQIIKGFGNDVISLKPIYKDTKSIRSGLIQAYLQQMSSQPGSDALSYIQEHEPLINSGVNMDFYIREIAKRSKQSQRELRRIWVQAHDDDLAQYYLEKVELEFRFKGTYNGIIDVLNWLAIQQKMMSIHDVHIRPNREDSSTLDAQMFVSVFIVKESFDED